MVGIKQEWMADITQGPLCLYPRSPMTHAVRTHNMPGARDTATTEAKPLLSRSSQARTQSTHNGNTLKQRSLQSAMGTERKKHLLGQGGVREGFKEKKRQTLSLTAGVGTHQVWGRGHWGCPRPK